MSTEQMTRVVILHAGGTDPSELPKSAGIKLPFSSLGFTDKGLDSDPAKRTNQHNAGLRSAAGRAHHLFIEAKLLDAETEDSVVAKMALMIQSHPHAHHVFADGVVLETTQVPSAVDTSNESQQSNEMEG